MTVPMVPFTAHNIRLQDGSLTKPGSPLTAEEPVTRAVLRTLELLFPPASRDGATVMDLGCLEGGYTVEFARAGFEATGLDARQINIDRCQLAASGLTLPNLHFICDDARNLARHGSFDVIFCSGLLYHLDRPASFLKLLADGTRKALILQTHYALEDQTPKAFSLSQLTLHDGHPGRWYREFPDQVDPAEMEASNWSSYGNSQSFWLERHSLLQALREVGFDSVYEQLDFVANNVTDRYIEQQHRSLFVAVRL